MDIYSSPWIERQCRCPGLGGQDERQQQQRCPQTLDAEDGHTVMDRSTRLLKTCRPLKSLPMCRYFRDVTWTIEQRSSSSSSSNGENISKQTLNCICPSNSVAYISRHEAIQDSDGLIRGYRYSFACSPQNVSESINHSINQSIDQCHNVSIRISRGSPAQKMSHVDCSR